METDNAAQVSELVDVLESMIVDHIRLLFVNTFVFFALTERPMELACCSRLLVFLCTRSRVREGRARPSVPGLECEKAERGHLYLVSSARRQSEVICIRSRVREGRARSSAYIRSLSEEQRFHLMPVHCWLIMFFVAQLMARVNMMMT